MKPTLLIIDDDPGIRKSISLALSGLPYELLGTGSLEEAWVLIEKHDPEVLLLDIHLGKDSGLDFFKELIKRDIFLPTICISGAATAKEAAEMIQLGAYEYIEKPVAMEKLLLSIDRCLRLSQPARSLNTLTTPQHLHDIIGISNEVEELKSLVQKYAPKDIKVLITGETGVGKELIAASLWKSSKRSRSPFIVVNSAAIPENLIESELFGHKKGAFTGAQSDQVGKIELAHKGTLFLDEIGDLDLNSQNKLLRFLENGEIQKLGSNQIKKIDARLIAATSRDLEKEIERGRFRSDLFYRLNVARVHIPPLRERKPDIESLFNYFIQSFSKKFDFTSHPLTMDCVELLNRYSWPGNIRELRNIAERSIVEGDGAISAALLKKILPHHTATEQRASQETDDFIPLKDFKLQAEKEYLKRVLDSTEGNVSKAARILGIDRTYLHQKIAKLGI